MGILSDRQPELREDAPDVLFDGTFCDDESGRDAAVRVSFGHQREDVSFTPRQLCKRVVSLALCDKLADKSRVDYRAAVRNAIERIDEVIRLHDPALKQIADASAPLQEVKRRVDLDVSRQDEDPDLGELGADRSRGVEAFPGLRRRHPDVDDNEIRNVSADSSHERWLIACLLDHVEPSTGQQAGDPFAQQHVVLSDNYAAFRHVAPKCTSV